MQDHGVVEITEGVIGNDVDLQDNEDEPNVEGDEN